MKTITMLGFGACLVSAPAAAYNRVVHAEMTARAVLQSSLPKHLEDYGVHLGLKTPESPLVGAEAPLFLFKKTHSVREWIQLGATDEDNGIRVRNHFYNPQADEGQEGLKSEKLGMRFTPSLDWGLGQTPAGVEPQLYSLPQAKEYLYQSIVHSNHQERERYLSKFFLSLGHIVHLVQDLAQPEHTRNDWHIPAPYMHSLYELWTKENITELQYTGYDSPRLGAVDQYWTTCPRGSKCSGGGGLADYSNRGFITTDTNFRGKVKGEDTSALTPNEKFRRPDNTGTTVVKKPAAELLGYSQPFRDPVLFIEAPVLDVNRAGTPERAWISSFSIFDRDLESRNANMTFTFNRFNAQSIHTLLVPRAVGYSVGVLDRIFRGKIAISPPKTGPYAHADHASATGFSSLRATLKNVTPEEHLLGGSLTAVVKFHRNDCYEPDLSGEFTLGPDGELIKPGNYCVYRTELESITTAKVPGVTLRSGEEREFTFQFTEEIPMDATDVYLQVVYRGPLGPDDAARVETEGLAVGARDLSEPTFYTVHNSTDLYAVTSLKGPTEPYHWQDFRDFIKQSPYSVVDRNRNQQYDGPPEDYNVRGGPVSCALTLRNERIATWSSLPEGRFARLAVLMDYESMPGTLRVVGQGYNNNDLAFSATSKRSQRDWERKGYVVSTVAKMREYNQYNVYTLYRLHPNTPPLAPGVVFEVPSREKDKALPVAMDAPPPAGASSLLAGAIPPFISRPPEGAAVLASEPAAPRSFLIEAARR